MGVKRLVKKTCGLCGRDSSIEVDAEGYLQWTIGFAIQDVLPDLDEGERERVITGFHSECYEDLFADEGY